MSAVSEACFYNLYFECFDPNYMTKIPIKNLQAENTKALFRMYQSSIFNAKPVMSKTFKRKKFKRLSDTAFV